MRTFKFIDSLIQCSLLLYGAGWLLIKLLHGMHIKPHNFVLLYYYLLGGWQLLSVAIHAAKPSFNRHRPRRIYLFCLLICLATACISYLMKNIYMFGGALLLLSPLLAVYYCSICIRETGTVWNNLPDDSRNP